IWRRCRIEQEGGPVDARCNFLEQLRPLAGNRWLHKGEAGGVAARSCQAPDEAAADWIGDSHKNDGDSMRLLQHRRSGGCVLRKNEIGLQRGQFFRGSLPHLRIIERPPAGNDSDVAAFRPPKLLESLPECGHISLKFRVALGMRHQHADLPHPFALLRARRERPCHRAAEKRDELAPPHSITSSARADSVGGTSIPSALAALRLITNSNLVD